jgi:hypothetical protein
LDGALKGRHRPEGGYHVDVGHVPTLREPVDIHNYPDLVPGLIDCHQPTNLGLGIGPPGVSDEYFLGCEAAPFGEPTGDLFGMVDVAGTDQRDGFDELEVVLTVGVEPDGIALTLQPPERVVHRVSVPLLVRQGFVARVDEDVDALCVKPLLQTGGEIVCVEDVYAWTGLGGCRETEVETRAKVVNRRNPSSLVVRAEMVGLVGEYDEIIDASKVVLEALAAEFTWPRESSIRAADALGGEDENVERVVPGLEAVEVATEAQVRFGYEAGIEEQVLRGVCLRDALQPIDDRSPGRQDESIPGLLAPI